MTTINDDLIEELTIEYLDLVQKRRLIAGKLEQSMKNV
jgi:hypothetical protein